MKENNKKIQEFFHKGANTRIAIFTNVMYHKEWILSVLLGREVAFWSDKESTDTKTNTDTDFQVICQKSTNKLDEINYFIGLFPLFLSTYTLEIGARKPIMVCRFQACITDLQTSLY